LVPDKSVHVPDSPTAKAFAPKFTVFLPHVDASTTLAPAFVAGATPTDTVTGVTDEAQPVPAHVIVQ
jgi:hypothetical protein